MAWEWFWDFGSWWDSWFWSFEWRAEAPQIENTKEKILKDIWLENSNWLDNLSEDELLKLSLLIEWKPEKEELLKSILEDNTWKEIYFGDLERLLIINVEKQEEISENQEWTQENQEWIQENQELESKDENYDKLFNKTQEIISQMDLSKFPNYGTWQQEARQQLLQSNPQLSLPENQERLTNLSESLVLLNHEAEFTRTYPNLKSEFSQLKWITWKLPEFKSIQIDYVYSDKPDVLVQEVQMAKRNLPNDGNPIKFEWTNILSTWPDGKQTVVDIKNPNQIEVKSLWYSIWVLTSSSVEDLLRLSKINKISQEISGLWKDYEQRKEAFSNLPDNREFSDFQISNLLQNSSLTPDIKTNLSRLQDLNTDLSLNKEQLETLKTQNQPHSTQEYIEETIKWIESQIAETIKQLETSFARFWQDTEKLGKTIEDKTWEYNDLVRSYDAESWNSKLNMEAKIERAKWVLEFLENIWIAWVIPQWDLETILWIVNSKYPAASWFSKPFTLETLLEHPAWDELKYHRELIIFFNEFLWLEWSNALKPENAEKYLRWTDKSFTSTEFKQRALDTLYTWWTLNISLIEKRFWENTEK